MRCGVYSELTLHKKKLEREWVDNYVRYRLLIPNVDCSKTSVSRNGEELIAKHGRKDQERMS